MIAIVAVLGQTILQYLDMTGQIADHLDQFIEHCDHNFFAFTCGGANFFFAGNMDMFHKPFLKHHKPLV